MKNIKKLLPLLMIPGISIIVIIILIFIFSDTPVRTIYFFFIGPFRNIFNIGNLLNASVPYIFGALGIIIAMKAGSLNLGGEGQVYLGAFITLITALYLGSIGISGLFGMILALMAGAFFSGSVTAISGICKTKWNTNELITTFLLSCAIIPIVNYLITGPFLDPDTSLVSTKKIAENMRLPFILRPSNLNTGIFVSFIFVYLTRFFLNKTKSGYEIRMTGFNELFARYGGINVRFKTIQSLTLSGCLYGIAGGIAVLGTHHAVIKEFSAGLGWGGLTVALIANFSPAAVIPCAIFLTWINTGARIAMQNTGLTFEIAYIVQAVIFLLSTSLYIKNLFIQKGKK
ncbi:MAG: ABC transporter permease [Treponema sp.]|nr:ABC transporter permease [Treponema sp.]